MNTRTLGADLTVSAVGLGCMGFSHAYGAPTERSEAVRAIQAAYDMGYTLFDTAETYGTAADPHENEKLVGEALKDVQLGVEVGAFPVGPGQQAVGHGGEGHKAHIQLLQHREQDLVPPCHHGVAVLHRRHRANCVGPAQIILRRLGNAPVGDFARFHQVGHYACHFLRLHIGVHPVLEVQVDMIGLEPPERTLHRGSDRFRPCVGDQWLVHHCAGLVEADAELGDDLHLVPDILQCLTHQLLILMGIGGGAVGLGGVEQGVTHIVSGSDGPGSLAPLCGRSVGVAEPHAAQSHSGDRQVGAQCACIYRQMPPCRYRSYKNMIMQVDSPRKFRFVTQYIPKGFGQ